jgi:hypothetical protein
LRLADSDNTVIFVTFQPREVVLVDFGVLCYDLRAWRHARRF